MNMLTDVDQAFLLLLLSGCLGACFAWALWEMEQARERQRRRRQSRPQLTWRR
jgi:hypothetical protein